MVDGIAFMDFIHERSVPYRKCDFFDEVMKYLLQYCNQYILMCVDLSPVW